MSKDTEAQECLWDSSKKGLYLTMKLFQNASIEGMMRTS